MKSTLSVMTLMLTFTVALFMVSKVTVAAPSLTHLVEDAQGKKISLSEFKGQVVYVDFWSSWCGPCRKSFPWMNEMHKKYQQQGLAVVAINLDVEVELAQQFLTELPAQFAVRYDPESEVARLFGLKGMPSSFIFNRQGELVQQHTGFFDKYLVEYEAELVSLLNQPPATEQK